MKSLGDMANIITAIVAIVALYSGWHTFSRQKTSADVEVIMGIFDRINAYWDLCLSLSATEKEKEYYIGQVLSYYENACFLVNKEIVSKQAFACLSDHIYEVWTKLNETEYSREYLKNLISSPTTFCEIKKFIQSHDIESNKIPSWRERFHRSF